MKVRNYFHNCCFLAGWYFVWLQPLRIITNTSYERQFLSSISTFFSIHFSLSSHSHWFFHFLIYASLACCSSLRNLYDSHSIRCLFLFTACMLLSVCFPPFHFEKSGKRQMRKWQVRMGTEHTGIQ